jgi:hypothetical protein
MTVRRTDRPTKVPGFPKIPAKTDPQMRQFLEAIVEAVDIRLGRKGDPTDRAITLRELIDSGLAKRLKASPYDPNNFGASNIGFEGPIPIGSSPTAPTGVSVNAAYSQINIFFDVPYYRGHAQTEIWSHTSDVLGDATLAGVSIGRSFVDLVGPGATRYYWLRHVNSGGVHGPWNASAGTLGETALDVAFMLDLLNGAITESELASTLTTPIAAIPGIQVTLSDIDTDLSGINSDISGINSDISGLTGNVNTLTSNQANFATTVQLNGYTTTTYLTSNYYTLNEVDQAITAEISTFNSQTLAANYTNTADLTTNYYTKTTADSAIAAAINTFNTNTIGPTYTSTADLTTNYYTKTTADSAIAAAINTFNTNTIGPTYTSTADLTTNYYTKTSADAATAAAINTYNTNTIGANYTNTADLTTNYYTKTGADSAISTAITTYNTNTIGANYTTTADLETNYYTKTGADSAFATTSDILNAQVDDPDGGTSQVTLAQAMSTQADVNGDLKGQYTVKIDANGAVAGFGLASTSTSAGGSTSEFYVNADRFAIMRGGSDTTAAVAPFVVQATATTINGTAVPAGVYIDAAFIKNASITAAQIGSINADTISTGTLSADYISGGTIDASQVNIAGVGTGLNISSASSGSRMAMASDVIKIFDGNTLRVQLGNLSA